MSTEKLRKLRIQNFRACVDVTIDFNESSFIVLLGANMTGKSTIIDALRLLRVGDAQDFTHALRLRGGKLARTSAVSDSLVVRGELEETVLIVRFDDNEKEYSHDTQKFKLRSIFFTNLKDGKDIFSSPKTRGIEDAEKDVVAMRDGIAIMSHSRTVPSYLASASEQGA
jgi:predicted ATP-dependent endonuclease of OLD family